MNNPEVVKNVKMDVPLVIIPLLIVRNVKKDLFFMKNQDNVLKNVLQLIIKLKVKMFVKDVLKTVELVTLKENV